MVLMAFQINVCSIFQEVTPHILWPIAKSLTKRLDQGHHLQFMVP
jgi:hypothetical protein